MAALTAVPVVAHWREPTGCRPAARSSSRAGLMLAGLPVRPAATPTAWGDELAARTACPVHRARLDTDLAVRRGAVRQAPPAAWFSRAAAGRIDVPVLGLHGGDGTLAPLDAARGWYAQVPAAELVSIAGGRHDVLNDQTHRTVAASIVIFLERLRLGPGPPVVARTEHLLPAVTR